MTPRQIERAFERLANNLTKNLTQALRETAREGLSLARQDSSGRWNRKRRQRAGYSYSRRNPNPPPQPLGVINIEEGVFIAAWQVVPLRSTLGGDMETFIVNRSDRVRDLVDATGQAWLSRPIDQRVQARIAPVFLFNVEKAIAKTLRGK